MGQTQRFGAFNNQLDSYRYSRKYRDSVRLNDSGPVG